MGQDPVDGKRMVCLSRMEAMSSVSKGLFWKIEPQPGKPPVLFGELCTYLIFATMKPRIANETITYIKIYTFMGTVLLFQDAYHEGSLQPRVVGFSLLVPPLVKTCGKPLVLKRPPPLI